MPGPQALQPMLVAHREAVDAFLAAARAVPPEQWTRPRAPGKWSPGQVVEHVALAYEVNRGVLHGQAPMRAPRLLRGLMRKFLLMPVLRRGRFISGSKSPSVFRPGPTPAGQAELLPRLETAMRTFEADAAAMPAGDLDHPFFGRLSLGDFVRLQEIHSRHHRAQLSPAAG